MPVSPITPRGGWTEYELALAIRMFPEMRGLLESKRVLQDIGKTASEAGEQGALGFKDMYSLIISTIC